MKRANIMIGVMSSMRLTLLLAFYGFSSLVTVECQPSPAQEVSSSAAANDPTTNQEISPFLVLNVGLSLYSLPYTWPEAPDQNDAIQMYTENNFFHHITAISYHYRRRLIFWSTTHGRVYRGSFMNRTRLNNVTHLQVLNGQPWQQLVIGDVAVDWISDKVYWTIRDEGTIEELDLDTNQRRIVVQSEGKASFNGLAVYPYPNNGWIYWTDREVGTIERMAVTGEGRQAQLVRGDLGKCIWPLEIDYSKQIVYWVNTCVNVLRSLQISNSEQSADRVEIGSSFSGTSSITLFEDVMYWNEGKVVKATNKSIERGEIIQIYQDSSSLTYPVSMELIHPRNQPQEEEFINIINEGVDMEELNKTCPPCINGRCIPPGVCACFNGWTGDNCTTDIDECARERDDCDYECHNTLGSFYCSCNSTSYLDSDGRTCILDTNECEEGSDDCDYECHNTLGSFYCSCNSSSYLDSDGRTCILDLQTTTTYTIDPTVSTTGMGIGPEETPPVLLLPSPTSTVASLATTAPGDHGLSTSSSRILSVMVSSSTFATRSQFTPSSVVLGPLETPTAASETTQSDADSSTDHLPSATEPSSNGMTLIIVASAAAGACVILIIVVIIMIAAVAHYASKRCGSYTVNPDPEKKSNGAPSWISVSVQSPSVAPAATNHHANGHSNGHSYQTKSFRASSPTCSTHSFT